MLTKDEQIWEHEGDWYVRSPEGLSVCLNSQKAAETALELYDKLAQTEAEIETHLEYESFLNRQVIALYKKAQEILYKLKESEAELAELHLECERVVDDQRYSIDKYNGLREILVICKTISSDHSEPDNKLLDKIHHILTKVDLEQLMENKKYDTSGYILWNVEGEDEQYV